MQTSLALLNRADGALDTPPDEFQREPFRHPGIDLLPRLSDDARLEVLATPRVAGMAESLGLLEVVRWKPRKV